MLTNLFLNYSTANETCVTIDGTGNKALDCARVAFRKSLPHEATKTAIANLGHCSGEVIKGNIVGHGSVGRIITGDGAECSDPVHKCLSIFNFPCWIEEFASLKEKRLTALVLWGCDTGAEQYGANLLSVIANKIKTPVIAPTGILCCNDGSISLEDGATWQKAEPDQPAPQPIKVPSHPLKVTDSVVTIINGQRNEFLFQAVTHVDFFYRTASPKRLHLAMSSERSSYLLQLIDFQRPYSTDCEPLATITGKLVLHFDETIGEVGFDILNNRILRSIHEPQTFYRCFDGFDVAFLELLRLETGNLLFE